MRIRQEGPFINGYNTITEMDGKHSDMLMDFGILKINKDQSIINNECKERAYVLIHGEVVFELPEYTVRAKRDSCFKESPYCLHIPSNHEVTIKGVAEDSEIVVQMTDNEMLFPPKFYTPHDVRVDMRGLGTMNEAGTRIVRTIFDKSNANYSNLVLGEVINFPGKWSSYPPHDHPQPEIYYYKFLPENGYGFCELGEDVLKVRNNDSVAIGAMLTHPQVTAPGYAMYYLWVIRHLDNDPYITPRFLPEHKWLMEKDAVIFPEL